MVTEGIRLVFLKVFPVRLYLMFTKQIILEPNQLPLTSEELGLVTPPISDALNATLRETLDALYSESTIAKIWGVAERALDKVSSRNSLCIEALIFAF